MERMGLRTVPPMPKTFFNASNALPCAATVLLDLRERPVDIERRLCLVNGAQSGRAAARLRCRMLSNEAEVCNRHNMLCDCCGVA